MTEERTLDLSVDSVSIAALPIKKDFPRAPMREMIRLSCSNCQRNNDDTTKNKRTTTEKLEKQVLSMVPVVPGPPRGQDAQPEEELKKRDSVQRIEAFHVSEK